MKLSIISGGQTGVDRGALDAALERGLPCGGWCPAGRKAEDGAIPTVYPVRELQSGAYRDRTEKNVRDSDATVIIYFDECEGGTELTTDLCRRENKPCLMIDASQAQIVDAADQIVEFVHTHHCRRLNVAGPRASKEPRAQPYARAVIGAVLDKVIRSKGPPT